METDMRAVLALALLMLTSGTASAWDGVDTESGNSVEIDKGNLVRSGRDIELYDYNTGTYRDMTVESIQRSGGSVEIEMYDSETGEYRTYEFND